MLWLDASDSDNVTTDGSNNVSQWSDKSGNGNNATQSDSNARPAYETAQQNGLNIINFGTNDWLEIGDKLDLGTNSMTVWVAMEVNDTNEQVLFKSRAASQAGRWQLNVSQSFSEMLLYQNNAGNVSPTPPSWPTWPANVVAEWHIDRVNGSANVKLNGVSGTAATFTSDTGDSWDTTNTCGIGTGNDSSGNMPNGFMSGNIYEIVVVQGSTAASASERDDMEQYLADKWGINVNSSSSSSSP